MKYNHNQNEAILRKKQKEISGLLDEVVKDTLRSLVEETFEQNKELLSKVSLSNESTKETLIFNIPIYNEVECIAKGGEYSAHCDIYTDSPIGYKILTAAWHGTGLSISQDIMDYIAQVTGKSFEDQFPKTTDDEGEIDPNKLSPFYLNPTNADRIFRDEIGINASDYPVEVEFVDKG